VSIGGMQDRLVLVQKRLEKLGALIVELLEFLLQRLVAPVDLLGLHLLVARVAAPRRRVVQRRRRHDASLFALGAVDGAKKSAEFAGVAAPTAAAVEALGGAQVRAPLRRRPQRLGVRQGDGAALGDVHRREHQHLVVGVEHVPRVRHAVVVHVRRKRIQALFNTDFNFSISAVEKSFRLVMKMKTLNFSN